VLSERDPVEDVLDDWLSQPELASYSRAVLDWLRDDLLTWTTVLQALLLVITFIIARAAAPHLRRLIADQLATRFTEPRLRQMFYTLASLALPAVWLLLLGVAQHAFRLTGGPFPLLRFALSLLIAWVVIRATSSLVRDPFASRSVAIAVWSVAALDIVGLFDPLIEVLDGISLTLGNVRVSVLGVIKAAALLALLLWLSSWLAASLDRRVQTVPRLTPSLRLLLIKLLKLALFVVAVLLALSSVGIDITAVAMFTGALGVGIGLGLQALVSNFVAGIILLVERSLKIGDFVELANGVRGEVRSINVRSTVITTNDSIDIIVPNSEFVNSQVTNWTFSEDQCRLRIPFGVAYGTDKETVRAAGLEAAAACEHTLTDIPGRMPQVWLVGFGDSSLNFELVVWLRSSAVRRPGAVNAAYYWALETALTRRGIEIPFPQRDIRVRAPVDVRMVGEDAPATTAKAPATPTPGNG